MSTRMNPYADYNNLADMLKDGWKVICSHSPDPNHRVCYIDADDHSESRFFKAVVLADNDPTNPMPNRVKQAAWSPPAISENGATYWGYDSCTSFSVHRIELYVTRSGVITPPHYFSLPATPFTMNPCPMWSTFVMRGSKTVWYPDPPKAEMAPVHTGKRTLAVAEGDDVRFLTDDDRLRFLKRKLENCFDQHNEITKALVGCMADVATMLAK